MKELLLLALFAFNAHAQVIIGGGEHDFDNSCFNPMMRTYRKDLQVVGLRFERTSLAGAEIVARIGLKNVGNVRFDGSSSPTVQVRVNGIPYQALMTLPLESEQTKGAVVALPAGTIDHCDEVLVEVDTAHDVGQFGCDVWGNDRARVTVYEDGQLPTCGLILRPWTPGGGER